jgi:hypothetical protein
MSFKDPTAPDVVFEHGGQGLGFKLVKSEDGSLMWFPTLIPENVSEQTSGPFSYDDRPKSVSQPISFDTWDGGCGVENAPAGTTRSNTYAYTRGIDPSWGELCLSPERTAFTGMTEAPTKFYRSPTHGWYALSATNVWRLSAGEWVSVYTPAAAPTDIIEYGNSTATYLFLAMGDSQQFVFTTSATFAGVTALVDVTERCTYFAVRGSTTVEPVLFAIKTNGLIRSSTAPVLSANWSNEDQIGIKGETVSAFLTAADLMWIIKEEAIYNFDGTLIGTEADVHALKRTGNGSKTVTAFNGHLFLNYENRILRLNPYENTLERLWSPTHTELSGTISAMAVDLRYVYAFVTNSDSNVYVVKIDYLGNEAPHTIAYLGAVTVNAAFVIAANSASPETANNILVFGRGAAASYFVLPRTGLKPWEDANCTFDIAGGTLYGSWVDAGAATYQKWLNGARALVQDASGAQSTEIFYALDGSDTATSVLLASQTGLNTARVTSEVEFVTIRKVVTMSTGSNVSTPRCQAILFDTTPNPPRFRAWLVGLDVGDQQTGFRGGERRPLTYKRAIEHLWAAVGERVTYTDYLGDEYTAKILNVEVKGVTPAGTVNDRANARSVVMVTVAEIAETLTIDDPFIWGATLTGVGGSKYASGAEWST